MSRNLENKFNKLCREVLSLKRKKAHAFLSLRDEFLFIRPILSKNFFKPLLIPIELLELAESEKFELIDISEDGRFALKYQGKEGKFLFQNSGTIRNVNMDESSDPINIALKLGLGEDCLPPITIFPLIREDVIVGPKKESTESGNGIIHLKTNDTLTILFRVTKDVEPGTLLLMSFMLTLVQID